MPRLTIARPDAAEYSPAVANYIRLVPGNDLFGILARQPDELDALVGGLSDQESLVKHAPYTWTIKQVLGHMADCERIFGYRALRLARNDATPLPGFDENAYMQAMDFDRCRTADLASEFRHTRQSHLLMLENLIAPDWSRRGTVNNHPTTVRAIAYTMAGHAEHHLQILAKRLAKSR